jgi:hypothetical protein
MMHATEFLSYMNATWWTAAASGAGCPGAVERIGPGGEGGKSLCGASALLSGRESCLVVSVGLNDDVRFESDLHARFEECEIHGFDGTLVGDRAALRTRLPRFLHLHPVNFDGGSWRAFEDRGVVDLLKIDCESCEHTALPSWLDHVCTEQIQVEIHAGGSMKSICSTYGSTPWSRAVRMHTLLARLDRDYALFAYEPNVHPFVKPGFCGEYAFRRRQPCTRSSANSGFTRLRRSAKSAGSSRSRSG